MVITFWIQNFSKQSHSQGGVHKFHCTLYFLTLRNFTKVF